jgi:hypothetical protein
MLLHDKKILFSVLLKVALTWFFTFDMALATESEYEYPELMVTPSATARLSREAKEEESSRWTNQTATQISSALVMMAGYLAYDDNHLASQQSDETPVAKWAGIGAMSAGGGLFLLTTTLSAAYRPYTKGWNKVKKIKAKSKRSNLAKQRAAEEHLEGASTLGNRIKWIGVVLNSLSAVSLIQSSENNETRVAGAIAALASFSPLLFTSGWEKSYRQHENYKKKIYGPIVNATFMLDKASKSVSPAMVLTWNY